MIVALKMITALLLLGFATSSCFMGEYYDSSSKICEQCDISCETCASADGCSTCYGQMYLSPVGNKVLCKICYQININCEICLSAQKCSACSTGYYVNSNNTCSTCSQHTPNCVYCNQDGSSISCITCNFTYTLIDGRCVSENSSLSAANSTVQSPVQASSQGNSQQGAQDSSQGAQNNSGRTGGSGVQSGQGGQVKIICSSNQVEIEGVCILAIPYCVEYDLVTLKCKTCTSDCILSDFGYCIPKIILVGNSSTAPSTSNASPASDNNVTAADCLTNQYFWYGQCVTIGTECNQRAQNDTCEGCIRGYRLQRGLCIQIPPNKGATQPSPSNPPESNATQAAAISSNCKSPCLTCASTSPDTCVTCISGFTTVDVFPGRCFPVN